MSLSGLNTVLYDGACIPVRSKSVDLVLLIEVLEHVRERERLLTEIARVLTTDGVAIISVPWSARIHYRPDDYLRPTPYEIERLAMGSGLEISHMISRGSTAAVVANKLLIGIIENLKAGRLAGVFFC